MIQLYALVKWEHFCAQAFPDVPSKAGIVLPQVVAAVASHRGGYQSWQMMRESESTHMEGLQVLAQHFFPLQQIHM